MRPGSQKRSADSRVFLDRLLLTLDDGKTVATELADSTGPFNQWVANDHDALLAA